MAVQTWVIGINHGKIGPAVPPIQADSLDDASRQLPQGAYTTFRTYDRQYVLRFRDHLERLRSSARLVHQSVVIDDIQIHSSLHEIIALSDEVERRIRITVDLTEIPGTIYVSSQPLIVPSPTDYERGVKVVTTNLHRNNPKAKLTNFIQLAESIRKTLPSDINEAIMVDENGRMLEGLSSNFFGVLGGEIWTTEEGVLSGITRSYVLDIAREQNLVVRLDAILISQISSLEESFITSASRAILPVTGIDQVQIGSGVPGLISKTLLKNFSEKIQAQLEKI